MKNKFFIPKAILWAIFFLSSNAFSQSKSQKQILKLAESYFDSSNFQAALPLYLQLHEKDSMNSTYNYAIGLCYYNSPKEKTSAIPFFEKVSKDKKSPFNKYVSLNLGQSYALAYRFNEAKASLEKYLSNIKKTDPEYREINKQIVLFKTAQDLVAHPLNYPIKNLGNKINSQYPEYSPIISGDESTLIFTTRRPTGTSGQVKEENGQFYEDIFISQRQEDGSWSESKGISSKINTEDHDASVGLSSDGQQLIVYKDDNGDGNLYISTLNGNEWSTPKKLSANINSDAYEPSACLSPDGNTIYFVSDRKGGYGLTDIYKSKKLPDGEWGVPINLGPSINTEKEEDAPFIQADEKVLYFSSKGRSILGGYDIVSSNLGDDGKWSTPTNIGYPINTTDDDLFYVVSANGKHAYYASAKEGGFGDKDIYQVALPASLNIALVKGRIAIDDNDSLLIQSSIEVTNTGTGELIGIYKPNIKTGKYFIVLNPNTDYSFQIKTEGFDPHLKDVSIPVIQEYTELYQEFHFYNKKDNKGQEVVFYDKITNKAEENKNKAEPKIAPELPIKKDSPVLVPVQKEGSALSTNSIYFKTGKSNLNPLALSILDKIYSFMKDDMSKTIKIEGYTDSQGSQLFNLKLSKARALVCKKYLVKKGIELKRITNAGFGELNPEFPNNTKEGRKRNRRVKLML